MSIDARLAERGIELPEPVSPAANYVRYHTTGNLLFISGTGPSSEHKKGKVGADVTLEEGYQAARSVGLQLLATAREALGSLDRISKTIKVLGMVNSDPQFGDQPKVINGCSDVLVEVLGEKAGRHTRSAVGFVALPNQISVEIEATFEFE
jgi:enamine deaminase RidA (YjgF/YER057c/UK114 family)